jgi:sugar diacid utilization regulator
VSATPITSLRDARAPRPAASGRLPLGHGVAALLDEPREAQAAMIEVVLAGRGLARVAMLAADAIGGPVAIVIPRLGVLAVSEHPRAPALLPAVDRWVTERTRGRAAAVPPDVVAEVPVRFRDQLAGAVALLRDERSPRADAREFLHAAAVATLMELAAQDAREETEQRLRGSFLEDLRSREQLGGAEIIRRAARLGCDLSGGGVILCAALIGGRARLVADTIASEHPGAVAQQLEGEWRPRVYAAIPACAADGDPAAATLASARRLAARLGRQAVVGVSSFHADPAELGDALREAELVLEVLEQSGAPLTDELASGTYRLLFRMLASHPDEVRNFYEETVAPLARSDQHNRTDLIHTLRSYLDANCNMNATAAAIFAHRHTVAYRLERIRELTGLDPMLSEDRERLGLGLKVHRIIGPGARIAV